MSCLVPLGCGALFLPALLSIGAWAVFQGLSGNTTIYLYHSDNEAMSVDVDGVEVARLTVPGAYPVRVAGGDHALVLRGARGEQRFSLLRTSGLDEHLLPTDPDICFVDLDVSGALYKPGIPFLPASGTACAGALDLARRVSVYDRFPVEVESPHFRVDELPTTIDLGTPVFLLVPVACAEATSARPGELLRRALGC
ncbi:MAG: hypothetical protein Q8P18_09280 [Pseudomonadota bacterium]|nr:hypothetical protein [Pseudomonadota bacterium]